VEKTRAPRNRTLTCSPEEVELFSSRLYQLTRQASLNDIENKIINQDVFEASRYLPQQFADLVVLDPPYNLFKDFHGNRFKEKTSNDYIEYFNNILDIVIASLKPSGAVYVCSDWKTSMLIAPLLDERLCVRSRITWEREKGRGSKRNWKNNTEDIWFCTKENSDSFVFNVDAVKLKRKVMAPYRVDGQPKDWDESSDGNFRLTHPSNIWTDITIPFWSMPENTDHPTQKPEKLVAKLLLASTNEEGLVFDPFLGSGTSAVVAKKLGRRFVGIEHNTEYCCWALKRLEVASSDASIQGYADGVFWERNSLSDQKMQSMNDLPHHTHSPSMKSQSNDSSDVGSFSPSRRRGRPRMDRNEENLSLF
jgi:site-specific DNA-methyltransferase (adenine-specific)